MTNKAEQRFQTGTVYTVSSEFLFVPCAYPSYRQAVSPGHRFLFREAPSWTSNKSCAYFYMVGASRDHYFPIAPKHYDKIIRAAEEVE
ncbi:MAG: hypothetical protein WC761_00185 [Candidatus Paceibacterota bacterium]